MPLHPTSTDIAARLLLTLAAGAVLGFNREAHGRAAGLRTTMLVMLAAALAMIEADLFLPLEGKTPSSFASLDPMRLAQGILTGVGFLGGGAILKKGGSVTGVTTAATLWIATVIGLCLGAGQLGLGAAATALGLVTLWAMQWVDRRIAREHAATLIIASAAAAPTPAVAAALKPLGCRVRLRRQSRVANARGEEEIETQFDLAWRQAETNVPPLDFLAAVAPLGRVKSFELVSGGL